MVVAKMGKPILKVSVTNSDVSSTDESEDDENLASGDENSEQGVIESDANSESSNEEGSDNELLMKNEGWADSVAKILGSNKPKNKKTLVLSKAKKYTAVVKKEQEEKPSFEVIGDSKEQKSEIKDIKDGVKKEEGAGTEPPAKKKKLEKPSIRVKPNILEKDRERLLNKIATKGVVQLFNAVRNQQKNLEKDLERNDLSESKKEKILKKFDKRTFLDSLMGQTKSVIVDEVKSLKNEVKNEVEAPKWSALRDDFMMGAKMKDWDKESVDE